MKCIGLEESLTTNHLICSNVLNISIAERDMQLAKLFDNIFLDRTSYRKRAILEKTLKYTAMFPWQH